MYTISFNPPRNLVRDVLLTPIILVATEATNFLISINRMISIGLLRWLSGKESTCQAGDAGSIPGSGRSPGGGNGNLLQYSCLENPMDRGPWWATVYRVIKRGNNYSEWVR